MINWIALSSIFTVGAVTLLAGGYLFLFWDRHSDGSANKEDDQVGLKLALYTFLLICLGLAAAGIDGLLGYLLAGAKDTRTLKSSLGAIIGGALVEGRSFSGIEPNRYRVETAQSLLGEVGSYPWEAVTAMEQAEFYGDPGRLYPQGWSMVHFLAASPEAKRNRQWGQILPTYFRALRSAWALERRRQAGGGSYQDAQRRARERARSQAFKGVDWIELEAAWRQHLSGLRRPSAR